MSSMHNTGTPRRVAAWLNQANAAPLLAWVAAPLLLIRLFILPVSREAASILTGPWHGDTASFAKSAAVLACALWMLIHLLLRSLADPAWRPALRRPVLFALPALAITAASALASPHPLTAWLGFPGLHEGGAVWIAYGVAFVYAAAMPDKTRILSWLRLLLPLAGTQILLGAAQACGHDFWQSLPGRWLSGTAGIDTVFVFSEARAAYGSLYQPNHYGMAMAVAGALAFAMAYTDPHRIWRLLWATAVPLCFFCIWLSRSRAGILAFFTAIAIWSVSGIRMPLIRTRPVIAVIVLLAVAGAVAATPFGRQLLDKTLRDLPPLPSATAADPAPARVRLEANRFTLPPDPAALTVYPNGWSRLDADGATLFFFTAGDDVWYVDPHGVRIPIWNPPPISACPVSKTWPAPAATSGPALSAPCPAGSGWAPAPAPSPSFFPTTTRSPACAISPAAKSSTSPTPFGCRC